jgi:hypothetical protein
VLRIFQRLAGTRTFAGDRLLRADDQRGRRAVGRRLGGVAGEGLLRNGLDHEDPGTPPVIRHRDHYPHGVRAGSFDVAGRKPDRDIVYPDVKTVVPY